MVKSAKFQMTIHIDYDREENKIQFLMDSQTKMISTLSLPSVISLVFKLSKLIHIISNKLFFFSYFLDNAKRICNSDYVPTMKDILHSRLKTVGVIELQIKMKGADFRVIDVGGQRTQRTKW